MMVRAVVSLIILLACIFQSCSLKKTGDEDISNARNYSKNIGKFSFRLIPFNPEKLMSVNYNETTDKISPAEKDSIIKEYNNFSCFVFEINVEGYTGDIVDFEEGNMEADYNKRLNYFLSDMQKDLVLKDSKGNEHPCHIYYFQRLSELAKTNKFIVGFNKPKDNEVTFQYKNTLLKCGTINFSLNKNNIQI